MNANDLKGLAVVTLADAAKVGHVSDILFDPQYRQILGFRVKRSALGHSETVLRRDVSAVGQDAITIPTHAALNEEGRFPELAGASTLGKVEGTRIVTESGTYLGTIHAVQVDDEARTVVAYELATGLLGHLRGEHPTLSAEYVRQIGEGGVMVVADAAADEGAAQTPGTPEQGTAGQTGQAAQPAAPAAGAPQWPPVNSAGTQAPMAGAAPVGPTAPMPGQRPIDAGRAIPGQSAGAPNRPMPGQTPADPARQMPGPGGPNRFNADQANIAQPGGQTPVSQQGQVANPAQGNMPAQPQRPVQPPPDTEQPQRPAGV